MNERQRLRLDALATILTGATPPASQPDSWGDAVDFITPSDQYDGQRTAVPSRRLSSVGAKRLEKRLVPAKSTNLTCIGSTIGKVTMAAGPSITNQQINTLVAKPCVSDPVFLYYLIKNWSRSLKGHASGSATPIINKSILSAYEFEIPDLAEQRAIAEVLGALDDKIAANTKLAETADALAVSTFNKALLDASFSDRTFADLARVSGGGTPSTKVPEYWDGDVPWATPTDVTALRGPYLEETSRTISEVGLAACASELYPAETILMTSRATIGAFALTQVPTAVNQGFIVVQAFDPDLHFWLFHEMRSRTDEFISLANGATFLELSRGNFKKFKVRLAGQDEMRRFNEIAKTLHKTAREALQENRILAATRDALLPQLMSGKLRVKDIENTMGEMV